MASVAPAAVETAAPAAPPAAPPSVPSTGGDPLDALRQDTIAWGHNPNGTAPAPSETNSEAPAVQTAEGSTPPTEAPATAAPSTAYKDWTTRYGGDPEKAAAEAFALEKRAAEMAKKLKEYESAQPTPAPAAEAQPVATAPAVAPTPTAPTVQAQPAQPTQPAQTVEDQAIEYALANDAQCRDLIAQHNLNVEELTKLTDPKAGEIATLRQQIANNNAVIAHPDVDELVKDNAKAALQRAEMTLAAREATASRLRLDNKSLDLDFRARVGGFVSQLNGQAAERSREAEFEKEAETKAQEFVGHWPTVFDATFKEMNLDPEMRAEIHEAVKEKALARPGRIDLKDLKTFMDEAVKAEFNKVDKYHRIQARIHAQKKIADTTPAAPTTAAAATALPTSETVDPLEQLRLETRRLQRQGRGAGR